MQCTSKCFQQQPGAHLAEVSPWRASPAAPIRKKPTRRRPLLGADILEVGHGSRGRRHRRAGRIREDRPEGLCFLGTGHVKVSTMPHSGSAQSAVRFVSEFSSRHTRMSVRSCGGLDSSSHADEPATPCVDASPAGRGGLPAAAAGALAAAAGRVGDGVHGSRTPRPPDSKAGAGLWPQR